MPAFADRANSAEDFTVLEKPVLRWNEGCPEALLTSGRLETCSLGYTFTKACGCNPGSRTCGVRPHNSDTLERRPQQRMHLGVVPGVLHCLRAGERKEAQCKKPPEGGF